MKIRARDIIEKKAAGIFPVIIQAQDYHVFDMIRYVLSQVLSQTISFKEIDSETERLFDTFTN